MNLDRFREGAAPPVLPLTALIDVLFLLIVFLVLGAHFDEVETVRLPEARGGPPSAAPALRLVLRPDGALWLEGRPLAPEAVIPVLRARAPSAVLLLPDERAEVGPLIRWYDRIRRELSVPVQVGVRPPPPDVAP
jgi:biopolymer transport protein ExbD